MLTMVRTASMVVFVTILFSLAARSSAGALPTVTSGTLVAQFQADAAYLTLDGNGTDVVSWEAANDMSIVLSRTGTAASFSNISFDSSDMGGNGAVVVNDFIGDNLVLQGAIDGNRTASTVFFLGYFSPERDGSEGDGLGQYIYSYGPAVGDGNQLDFQIDEGRAELYGGAGTEDVGDISGNNATYTVYRIESGGGGGADWAVYADGGLVNSGTNGANYVVFGDLILFGWQDGSGVSGGFNFVGNVGELLFYDGILDSNDTGAVESYLMDRCSACEPPPPLGDLDFDTDVDIDDWLIYVAGVGLDMTNLDDEESYLLGDLNGDQMNNYTDFVIFQTVYEAANPGSSFAQMTSSVPEPSSVVLLVTVLLLGALWCDRRSDR